MLFWLQQKTELDMASFSFDYDVIETTGELKEIEIELFRIAESKLKDAYAPYSKFQVSAAVLLDNGQIVSGTNQENASYSLAMCAERVALYTASSLYPGTKPVSIAIIAHNPHKSIDKPIPPCGACRQVILEFENRFEQAVTILLKDDNGKFYRFENTRQLLPLAFDKSFLEQNGL
jgi:cytidine deaminase